MADHPLKTTVLSPLHTRLGGKMVPFAGYAMPVQYRDGMLAEHRWTRAHAGLFDVSHMGQAYLVGEDPAAALERLVPGAITTLKDGALRYTLLLNEEGGIRDDLMATRLGPDRLHLVVNAACKQADFAHIEAALAGLARLERLDDRALIALQGPDAEAVLAEQVPDAVALKFMKATETFWQSHKIMVSRSGYTGEDGFEVSLPVEAAEAFAEALLADERVRPIGLGARDTLRLEAGLCLYGHDIDETTNPVEADLAFTIGKARREAGDFPGAAKILRLLREGTTRKRVGIRLRGRGIAREGAEIATPDGTMIGTLTSGGFGASVDDGAGAAIGMGYVPADLSTPGTELALIIRGKPVVAEVAALPFYQKSYKR